MVAAATAAVVVGFFYGKTLTDARFMAPPVKNWRILLVQRFAARMPLAPC